MLFSEYQKQAMVTRGEQCDTLYGATKLMVEAAELAQPIVKNVYHSKAVDVDGIKEEIGDLFWYLALIADDYGIDLDDAAQYNIDKLRARHGDKYNSAHYAS